MLKVMQDFGHQPSKTTTLVYFAMRVHTLVLNTKIKGSRKPWRC